MIPTRRDEYYINKAFDACQYSDMSKKHGCVIVDKSRVIGTGYNSYRNQFCDDFIGDACSCHAEMHALRVALRHKFKTTKKNTKVVLRPKVA